MSTLTIEQFGDELLRTGDLDPVYVALHEAELPGPQLYRLCLTYWCVYHLGVAAQLSELSGKRYWDKLEAVAVNASRPDGTKPWPRGAERRHFRGQQAIDAVAELRTRYKTPEDAVHGMLGGASRNELWRPTFQSVSDAVQTHRGFGPWIAFKIADMSERVLGFPTDFTDCQLGLYKDPRQGAALACYERLVRPDVLPGQAEPFGARPWDWPISDELVKQEVDFWVTHWRKKKAKAPPARDRLVNAQEIETIFCKYKSHRKGHYPSGKDTAELKHALQGWGDLAEQLRRYLP